MAKPRPILRSLESLSDDSRRIIRILKDEPDHGVAIIGVSYVDACLFSLLHAALRKSSVTERMLAPDSGALGSFAVRGHLAYITGLIDKALYQDLSNLATIRNKFAHTHLETTFKDSEIAALCGRLAYTPTDGPHVFDEVDLPPRTRFVWKLVVVANQLLELASTTKSVLPD